MDAESKLKETLNNGFEAPGLIQIQKVVSVYEQSTGSIVRIYDRSCQPVETDGGSGIERAICRHCSAGDKNNSCRELHINALRESGRSGKPSIYHCELGLMFWACPVYSEGKFSGALRASGFLGGSSAGGTAGIDTLCNGTIPREKFAARVNAFPVSETEKIESLAEMLLLCAESLSTGSKNYHKIQRFRSEHQAALSVLIDELKIKYPEGSAPPAYPLDKEQQLIEAMRRGNREEADRLLNEILAVLVFGNQDHFRYIQLRALELAVLIARAGTSSGGNSAESNACSIRQIQDAKTVAELAGILHCIMKNIARQIIPFQGIPHASAMRKAEIYIRENFTRKLSLNEVAKVAGLSSPYFSTIFKEEMGENLSKYINRMRVEKAGEMLLETDCTLSEISGACCFEDQSWFSKIFKAFTGMSPGKYRSQGGSIRTSNV